MPKRFISPELTKASGVRITYAPRGHILDVFHDHSDEILLYGAAGTGKSLGNLHKLHLVLSKYPKAKGFMSRKTRTSMTNACLDTFQKQVLQPQDKVHFHKQDQQFNYPNGSMCAVFGLDEPARVMSTEFDIGFIQEATECNESDIEIVTTRLRGWTVPYQQLLMDCNPDRPNHWLKRRVDKGKTKGYPTNHKDNPKLWHQYEDRYSFGLRCPECIEWKEPHWSPEGIKYLAKLDRLSGARRSRLYLGQWVSAEGVVYEDWDPQIHMISRHDLPLNWHVWPRYWAHDWGHIHPLVWQEWIENPDTGQLYLLRQIYRTKNLVEDLGREIKQLTHHSYIPQAIICDHDAEDRAVLERHTGYLTLPAYKDIKTGIQAVQSRLKPDWCRSGPGLFIVRDSLIHKPDIALEELGLPVRTEDEFDGYVWDTIETEKADKRKDELPVDKNNHGMDGVRYMVAFADNLADDPEEFEAVIFNDDEVSISRY